MQPEYGEMPHVKPPHERKLEALAPLGTAFRRLELTISLTLRFGVLISSALIVVGLVGLLPLIGSYSSDPIASSVLSSAMDIEASRSPIEILNGLRQGNPSSVVDLGLLVLILTPMAPVLLSLLGFCRDREMPFVLITAFVLGLLILGLLWGR